jgi:hypothetical protein
MSEGQRAIDDAVKRCDFLRTLLRKKISVQVWSEGERGTVKATCLAWFHSQRGPLAQRVPPSALADLDSLYNALLLASGHAGSRSGYQELLKSIKKGLLVVRSECILASLGASASKSPDLAPSFASLVPDPKMQAILERRWNECVICLADAPMAATVMMGGLLEGLLLARVNREPSLKAVFTASKSPKDKKSGAPLPLRDWMLKNFTDVAHELGWISNSAKDVGVVLGEYRNYIHPQKELSHGVVLTKEDAVILWGIAKSIANQLLK